MGSASRATFLCRTSFVAAVIPKISAAGDCGAVVCTTSGLLRPTKLSSLDADGYLRQLHRHDLSSAGFFSSGRPGQVLAANPYRGGNCCCLGKCCPRACDASFTGKVRELPSGLDEKINQVIRMLEDLQSHKDSRVNQVEQAVPEVKENAGGGDKTSKSGEESEKKLTFREKVFTCDSYFSFAWRYCFYCAACVGYYSMGLTLGEVYELIQYHHQKTSSYFRIQVHEFRVQKLTAEAESQKKAVDAELVRVKHEAVRESFVKLRAAKKQASQGIAAALADASQKKAMASEEAIKNKASALQEAKAAEKEAIDEANAAAADADAEYMAAVLASENVSWYFWDPVKAAAKKAAQKKFTAEAAYAKRSAAAKAEYAKKIAASDEVYAQKCEAADFQSADDSKAATALCMQGIENAISTCSRKRKEADEDAKMKKSQLDHDLAVAIAKALKMLKHEDTAELKKSQLVQDLAVASVENAKT